MKWSPQQETALQLVNEWYKTDRQVFNLGGFAGTGKTELARHFAEGVGGQVLFGAYTGKAALVLQNRGCSGARTIHSLIYLPKEKSRQRLIEMERKVALLEQVDVNNELPAAKRELEIEQDNLNRPHFALNSESEIRHCSLLILDECSMIGREMAEDLLSFGCKILTLGDPAQLPPVGDVGFFEKPDYILTEIHRQARDSPILRLATLVRQGKPYDYCDWGDVKVLRKASPEMALSASQVLVGRNKTRRGCNARIRELANRANPFPQKNDKLVALRNDHDRGILNGSLWTVWEDPQIDTDLMRIAMTVQSGTETMFVDAHLHPFTDEPQIPIWIRRDAQEFDYGYALTVHKAQGSQWDNVLLFDESECFKRDRWRWLYTGITRASKQLTVVK